MRFADYSARLVNVSGPIVVAASNFAAALIVQQRTSAAIFGLYAFIQVVIATGLSLSNGLFGSPLLIVLTESDGRVNAAELVRSCFAACLAISLVAAMVMSLVLANSISLQDAVLFSSTALLGWVRWFFRGLDLARSDRGNARTSDMFAGGILLVGCALLAFIGIGGVRELLWVQVLASGVPAVLRLYGWREAIWQRVGWEFGPFISAYQKVGAWSIASIVATQCAINSHAFIITTFAGSAAYAPVALAVLAFRPLGVVVTALMQYEQARVRDAVLSKGPAVVDQVIREVRIIVAIAWLGNAAVASLAAVLMPTHGPYALSALLVPAVAVAFLMLLRAIRESNQLALEAGGRFKSLASVIFWCVPVAYAAAGIGDWVGMSVVSSALLGSVLAEAVLLYNVRERAVAFRSQLVSASTSGAL